MLTRVARPLILTTWIGTHKEVMRLTILPLLLLAIPKNCQGEGNPWYVRCNGRPVEVLTWVAGFSYGLRFTGG